MSNNRTPIHIIAGPTASGKSAVAMELARSQNGVIINCDSIQIYDGLPVLTAQPLEHEKEDIPHKLYGTLHPNDICSAGRWREMVEPIIEEALSAEQTPIVVGGTGLYIKALIEGLSPMPDIPDEIRAAAVEKQRKLGNPAFHAELQKRDPVMAERFHPFHTARLVRAWEVLETTGQSLAEWQKLSPVPPPAHWSFKIHKIIPERSVLRERCDNRFAWMMENGALENVAALQTRIENREVDADVPLTKAIGFHHLGDYLAGRLSKEEAIEKSQAETRQYAKRQVTWFRHQLD